MLIEKTARNGLPIALIDDIHLASSFDPQKEAERWAQKQMQEVGDVNIVLLGLGCGYHALEVAERCQKKVYVLEKRGELVSWFYKHSQRQFPHLVIWSFSEENSEKSNENVNSLFGKPFVVLQNPYSQRLDENFYHSMNELLIGRSQSAWQEQLQHRTDLANYFEEIKFSHPGDHALVGINDVKDYIRRSTQSGRPADIMKTLLELVK